MTSGLTGLSGDTLDRNGRSQTGKAWVCHSRKLPVYPPERQGRGTAPAGAMGQDGDLPRMSARLNPLSRFPAQQKSDPLLPENRTIVQGGSTPMTSAFREAVWDLKKQPDQGHARLHGVARGGPRLSNARRLSIRLVRPNTSRKKGNRRLLSMMRLSG